MTPQRIGFLHPGDMGISIAASAQNAGNEVYWASEGRSPDTQARAANYGLRDAHTLAELCAECAIIVSVCPPHAAEEVAQQVLANGFGGMYLDANAIAPQRAEREMNGTLDMLSIPPAKTTWRSPQRIKRSACCTAAMPEAHC